jgi:hypothetical protein
MAVVVRGHLFFFFFFFLVDAAVPFRDLVSGTFAVTFLLKNAPSMS